jgi:hypothetical protein
MGGAGQNASGSQGGFLQEGTETTKRAPEVDREVRQGTRRMAVEPKSILPRTGRRQDYGPAGGHGYEAAQDGTKPQIYCHEKREETRKPRQSECTTNYTDSIRIGTEPEFYRR